MRKWAGRILLVVSTLMLILSAGMWVRSYFVADRWTWPNPSPPVARMIAGTGSGLDSFPRPEWQTPGLTRFGNHVVNSAPGAIEFVVDTPPWPRVKPFHSSHELSPGSFQGEAALPGLDLIDRRTKTVQWSLLGFEYDDISGDSGGSSILHGQPLLILIKCWRIPYWPMVLLSGMWPACWLHTILRNLRRSQAGKCSKCGYDLRATPERCPECGEIPRPSQIMRAPPI
jgi:hypothetical protein